MMRYLYLNLILLLNFSLNAQVQFHSADNKYLAVITNEQITVTNKITKAAINFKNRHRKTITCFKVNEAANTILSGDEGGIILTWNLKTGSFKDAFEGHLGNHITLIAQNPTGTIVISVDARKNAKVWSPSIWSTINSGGFNLKTESNIIDQVQFVSEHEAVVFSENLLQFLSIEIKERRGRGVNEQKLLTTVDISRLSDKEQLKEVLKLNPYDKSSDFLIGDIQVWKAGKDSKQRNKEIISIPYLWVLYYFDKSWVEKFNISRLQTYSLSNQDGLIVKKSYSIIQKISANETYKSILESSSNVTYNARSQEYQNLRASLFRDVLIDELKDISLKFTRIEDDTKEIIDDINTAEEKVEKLKKVQESEKVSVTKLKEQLTAFKQLVDQLNDTFKSPDYNDKFESLEYAESLKELFSKVNNINQQSIGWISAARTKISEVEKSQKKLSDLQESLTVFKAFEDNVVAQKKQEFEKLLASISNEKIVYKLINENQELEVSDLSKRYNENKEKKIVITTKFEEIEHLEADLQDLIPQTERDSIITLASLKDSIQANIDTDSTKLKESWSGVKIKLDEFVKSYSSKNILIDTLIKTYGSLTSMKEKCTRYSEVESLIQDIKKEYQTFEKNKKIYETYVNLKIAPQAKYDTLKQVVHQFSDSMQGDGKRCDAGLKEVKTLISDALEKGKTINHVITENLQESITLSKIQSYIKSMDKVYEEWKSIKVDLEAAKGINSNIPVLELHKSYEGNGLLSENIKSLIVTKNNIEKVQEKLLKYIKDFINSDQDFSSNIESLDQMWEYLEERQTSDKGNNEIQDVLNKVKKKLLTLSYKVIVDGPIVIDDTIAEIKYSISLVEEEGSRFLVGKEMILTWTINNTQVSGTIKRKNFDEKPLKTVFEAKTTDVIEMDYYTIKLPILDKGYSVNFSGKLGEIIFDKSDRKIVKRENKPRKDILEVVLPSKKILGNQVNEFKTGKVTFYITNHYDKHQMINIYVKSIDDKIDYGKKTKVKLLKSHHNTDVDILLKIPEEEWKSRKVLPIKVVFESRDIKAWVTKLKKVEETKVIVEYDLEPQN